MEFEALEQLALADRSEWPTILSKISISRPQVYSFLSLLHNNKNGVNDAEIQKIIKEGRTPESELRNRYLLERFNSLTKSEKDDLVGPISRAFSVSHSDTKTDSSSSYATESFVPRLFKPETLSFDNLFQNASGNNFSYATKNNPFLLHKILEWVSKNQNKVSPSQLDSLMDNVTTADSPHVVPLLASQMTRTATANTSGPRSFGSNSWHARALTLSQLEELRKLVPGVIESQEYVNAVIFRLLPPNVQLDKDPAAYERALQPVLDFVNKLAHSFNNHKALVIYNVLLAQVRQGKYDEATLNQYLTIPKYTPYSNNTWVELQSKRHVTVAYLGSYPYVGQLRVPNSTEDEVLIKHIVTQLFISRADWKKSFESVCSETWLKQVFATAKLLFVPGTNVKNLVPSHLEDYQWTSLKKEVRLEIDPYAPVFWPSAGKVSLKVQVKNVPKLIVNLFEINTLRYYRDNLSEVPSDISLEGLVASEEQQYQYDNADFEAVNREFSFPSLDGRAGVFVIEFVGSGQSKRAVIYKGRYNVVQRPSIAGHVFTVTNEKFEKVIPAHLWMAGHLYHAEDDGEITVPYSTSSAQERTVVVYGGDDKEASPFADLFNFTHQTESYSFNAQFHVEREALVPFNKTSVLIKPKLLLNNSIVTPVSLLTDVFLTVSTVDIDDVASSKDVPLKFNDDEDATFDFQVPDRLSSISFSLRAAIKKVSDSSKVNFYASKDFSLNGIDKSDRIEQMFLRRTAGAGYSLLFLGKTGDAIPRREVSVSFRHYFFTSSRSETLTTDDNGVIPLGHLSDIVSISAAGVDFPLDAASTTNLLRSSVLHLKQGQALEVALNEFELASKAALSPEYVSLVSVVPENNNVVLADYFHLLKFEKGTLSIPRGLLPGTYELVLKRTNITVTILVQQALQSHSNFLFGADFILEKSPFSQPLQVADVEEAPDTIKIELSNATSATRVHVFASEYVPEYDVRDLLRAVPQPSITKITQNGLKEAQFVSRTLSEEQRYILDRRYAPARQGNTLTPPSLLLNPWVVDTTTTTRKDAAAGGAFASAAPRSAHADSASGAYGYASAAVSTTHYRNFDFKFHACKPLYNLKADDKGVVSIKRASLGGTPNAPLLLRIMAVDSSETVFREHPLKALTVPEPNISVKDLRLKPARALNPEGHFAEQKGITLLQVNDKFTVEDLSTSKIEVLDSMQKVYGFFSTVSGNVDVQEWNWLLKWPALSTEEKEEKYHTYASHELHVFLYFKDRAFFDKVILPYLKNKLQKTFIDEWLVIEDPVYFLKYTTPGLFVTLNAAEKALLAHKLKGKEGEALAKSLHDLAVAVAFSRSDRNQFNHLFKTILGSSSLNTESDGYVPEAKEEAAELEKEILRAMPPPAMFRAPAVGAAAPVPMMMSLSAAAPSASRARKSVARAREAEMDMDEAEEEDNFGYAEEKKKSDKRKLAKKEKVESSLAKRNNMQTQQLFQAPEKTKKYAESQYYHQADPSQSASLINMNAFWADYAQHRSAGGKAFLSKNFIYATSSFAEMVLALAVLDLPLARPATPHPTEFTESGMILTAGAPVIVFHKDIQASVVERRQVLVTQTFFDPNDRHSTVNGERVEKYVEEEFLNRKVYGCNYIITNISSTSQRVEVLLQLPVGAIPVLSGSMTKSVFFDVPSYTTQSGQFYFYFPRTGDYATFPVHISRDEKTISFASMQLPNSKPSLHVVDQLSKHDLKSWNSYISQLAPPEQVLEYLQNDDIFTVDLTRAAWRFQDAIFCKKALAILRERSVYNKKLWGYSVKHQDTQAMAELFMAERNYLRGYVGLNACLQTSFPGVTTHPWAIRVRQHYEFWPLINARAHKLGEKRVILNDGFKSTYQAFLDDLSFKAVLGKTDLLAACYFMLLQDRVEEAITLFNRAQAAPLEACDHPDAVQLQVDYLTAYLDFFNEKPTVARTIVAKYLNYPVLRWRRMFQEIQHQLAELDSGVRPEDIIDPDDRNARMGKAARSEPTLDVETANGKILLHHHSLKTATLSFYKMDIELLFSSSDFNPNALGKFAYVKPNYSVTIELAKEGNETEVVIPKELDNTNVMIEVTAGPHAKVVSYFSHSLLAKLSESYGQVQVHDKKTAKPLSRVYVKVFAAYKDGSNRFYKDGYTDIRGAFDYASLSTDELPNVSKFFILVMSASNGTRILSAAPPAH